MATTVLKLLIPVLVVPKSPPRMVMPTGGTSMPAGGMLMPVLVVHDLVLVEHLSVSE
jgi:hypothetical protein